jgi:3-methyladenine DNA glycosylase AlkD
MFFSHVKLLAKLLMRDGDDMVQKGLGWLLRETAKHNAANTIPFLLTIRPAASRLVMRTACETLPIATRKRILAA